MTECDEMASMLIVPIMTKEYFSEQAGWRFMQVRGQMERNNLPSIRIGRLRLVNIAKLALSDTGVAIVHCPAMSPARFGLLSGLTKGQVETQIYERHLPTLRIGRLVAVDVFDLFTRCLNVHKFADSQAMGAILLEGE